MFSERLKTLRAQADISQKELAERLFVSQQSVAKWETDKSTPNPDTIARIAEIFCVSSDYLLGISDNPSPIGEKAAAALPADMDYSDLSAEDQAYVRGIIEGIRSRHIKK